MSDQVQLIPYPSDPETPPPPPDPETPPTPSDPEPPPTPPDPEPPKRQSTFQMVLQFMTAAQRLLTVLAVLVLAGAILFGVMWLSGAFTPEEEEEPVVETTTVKLNLEDIGVLATQSAYCTIVNVLEDDRDLFGISIPFTQSKYIYSYNVKVNAGYNFGDIEYELYEDRKTIRVQMPEARVLDSILDKESLQIYHEEESVFRPITMEEINAAQAEMERSAEETAIANGILEEARTNAETILKTFFGQAFDPAEYDIVFTDK